MKSRSRTRSFFVIFALLPGLSMQVRAQQAASAVQITDLPADSAQKAAITRIVDQSIMTPVSAGIFAPESGTTLRQYALAVQRLFQLPPQPAAGEKFADLTADDPDSAALGSVVPYLRRNAFCPGCALNNYLRPDNTVSSAAEAVAITSLLIERGRIALVSAAQADQILAGAANLGSLPEPARRYLATAVQNGIVTTQNLGASANPAGVTRANTAVLLDHVQTQFSIPTR